MTTDFDNIRSLCIRCFEQEPLAISPLKGAGSNRRYFRVDLPDGKHVIATVGSDTRENRAFVMLDKMLMTNGIHVPEVYGISSDFTTYLQEDLGSTSLFDLITGGKDCEQLVRQVMDELPKIQTIPEAEWSGIVNCRPFSRRQVMWDLNYFKYEFAMPSHAEFDANLLEDDFELLCQNIMQIPVECRGLMYRDCQSRNVMVHDGNTLWIDFQGAMEGPAIYDAVSFLWQAKAKFSSRFRHEMLMRYIDNFCRLRNVDPAAMLESKDDIVLLRTLQVLGAYGFRGLVEKKAHFLESIPPALENLKELVQDGALDKYPELKHLSKALVAKNDAKAELFPAGQLTISVFSFSYKKGYPDDLSGNGGGFMFDCRGMHNPGRYPEYKQKTGRDAEVIQFLEERGEVQVFLANAEALVRPTIERYLQRGFSSLTVGFGCTGGQHRSVYCAEGFARWCREQFPQAIIRLVHREHPTKG